MNTPVPRGMLPWPRSTAVVVGTATADARDICWCALRGRARRRICGGSRRLPLPSGFGSAAVLARTRRTSYTYQIQYAKNHNQPSLTKTLTPCSFFSHVWCYEYAKPWIHTHRFVCVTQSKPWAYEMDCRGPLRFSGISDDSET